MSLTRDTDETIQGLTPDHFACFVAGRAVAFATAYLEGDDTSGTLARNAERLMAEALIPHDGAESISDPTRLLIITMMRAAIAKGARVHRWRSVMAAFVRLVREEVGAFHRERAQ